MDSPSYTHHYTHKQLSTLNIVCITVSIIAILASAGIVVKRNSSHVTQNATVYSFHLVDGQVQSGPTEISAEQGETLLFTISSDTAGTFHIADYPVRINLSKNTPAQISFTVNEAGRFSYEFGPQNTVLGSINIAPK